jgi:hypothetical protein
MPFCPNCRSEYVAGKTICPDCDIPLVAKLNADDNDEAEWEVVYESATEIDADMIRGRLEDEGIPARVFSQADHALGLTVGDLAVVRVLVHPDDADDARALVLRDESIDPDSLTDLAADDDNDRY